MWWKRRWISPWKRQLLLTPRNSGGFDQSVRAAEVVPTNCSSPPITFAASARFDSPWCGVWQCARLARLGNPFFLERRRTGIPITDPRMTRFNISPTRRLWPWSGMRLRRPGAGSPHYLRFHPTGSWMSRSHWSVAGCDRKRWASGQGEDSRGNDHGVRLLRHGGLRSAFAILSPNYHYTVDDYIAQTGARRVIEGFRYNSGENCRLVVGEQV